MITLLQKQQDYFDDRIADAKDEGRSEGRSEGTSEGRREGIALGEAKGMRENQIATATTALGLGMFPAQVAAITGLTIDEVTELQCSLSRAH